MFSHNFRHASVIFFLNLDEAYPNQIFTILIWSSDRPKVGDPEAKYGNKKVCVRGLIDGAKGDLIVRLLTLTGSVGFGGM